MTGPHDTTKGLDNTDWSDAEVVREQRPVSIVHSVRLPDALSQRLEAEASQRGMTPSALIRELLEAALPSPTRAAESETQTVTVRVVDIQHAVDTAVRAVIGIGVRPAA